MSVIRLDGEPFAPDDISVPANTPTAVALVTRFRRYNILAVSSEGSETQKIAFRAATSSGAGCTISGNFSIIPGRDIDVAVREDDTHIILNSAANCVVRVQGYALVRDGG